MKSCRSMATGLLCQGLLPCAKFSWSRICEMQLHKVLSRLSATEEAMASSVDDAVWLEKVLCTLNPKSHEKWTFLERPHSLRLFFQGCIPRDLRLRKKRSSFQKTAFSFQIHVVTQFCKTYQISVKEILCIQVNHAFNVPYTDSFLEEAKMWKQL